MNLAYQVLLSVSEIFGAILFVIAARSIRLNARRVTITCAAATGNELIYDNTTTEDAENEVARLIITKGIRLPNKSGIKDMASKIGILYHGNLVEMHYLLRSCREGSLCLSGNSAAAVRRQMFECTPTAGILTAYVMDSRVEVV